MCLVYISVDWQIQNDPLICYYPSPRTSSYYQHHTSLPPENASPQTSRRDEYIDQWILKLLSEYFKVKWS